ncbi:hypothetical protein WKY82_10445 [Gordonia malaquae]|uniref:hypothetical protein n=1 Tax=Gordonia malaquae TaxID=410332 RepID=UPI0030C78AAB
MSWDARLVLKGLESYVDDNGVGKDDVALIVGDVFPRDMLANPRDTVARVSEAISELFQAGLVWRYDVENTSLLYVSNWEAIQRIDKPGRGRLPRPDGTLNFKESVIRESVARPRESVAPGTEEQRNRGTGEQTTTARERARAPRESSSTFADGTPIPPEPPHDSDEHVVVAEIVPSEIGTAATLRTPKPSPAHKTTVRTILGGAGYPDTTITQLATQVGKLAGKHDAELIAEALREWDRRPDVKPAFLGSVLGDVVKARRARPAAPKSTTDERMAAVQALKRPAATDEQRSIG